MTVATGVPTVLHAGPARPSFVRSTATPAIRSGRHAARARAIQAIRAASRALAWPPERLRTSGGRTRQTRTAAVPRDSSGRC